MKIEFAPLEGVTAYPFRMAHQNLFRGVDQYYLPFVSVHSSRSLNQKEKKDLLPEHNPGNVSVPQLLANNPEDFLVYVKILREYGYKEINLNLGCPSGTVVAKRKGAGFLRELDRLDEFFDFVFREIEGEDVSLSVKTRIGIIDNSESEQLIPIYNRYPISELIVHPRYQKQFYRGITDLDTFKLFYENCTVPISYNGDIFSRNDAKRLIEQFPNISGLMLGRGLIANPALAREIKGGAALTKEEMRAYHDLNFENWSKSLGDPNNALHRMKELWDYLKWSFTDCERLEKRIRKAKTASEYTIAVNHLFDSCELMTR